MAKPYQEIITIDSGNETDDPSPQHRARWTSERSSMTYEPVIRSRDEERNPYRAMNAGASTFYSSNGTAQPRPSFDISSRKDGKTPRTLEKTGDMINSSLGDWTTRTPRPIRDGRGLWFYPQSTDLNGEGSSSDRPILLDSLSSNIRKISPLHRSVRPGSDESIPAGARRNPPIVSTKSPGSISSLRSEQRSYSMKTKSKYSDSSKTPVTCRRCRDDGKICDGRRPCTTCRKDRQICKYETTSMADVTDRLQDAINEVTSRVKSVPVPANNVEFDYSSRDDPEEPSAVDSSLLTCQNDNNEPLSAQHKSPRTIADLLFDHLSNDDDEEGDVAEIDQLDDASKQPVSLEPHLFNHPIASIKTRMEMFHEETVMAALRASKQRSKSQPVAATAAKANPFDRIITEEDMAQRVSLLSKPPKPAAQWEPRIAPYTAITSSVLSLPKTKSIGRVGPSLLSRNATIGKYHPYSHDDEGTTKDWVEQKYKEVKERYHDFSSNSASFSQQRTCAELVDMYRQFVDGLLDWVQITARDVVCFYLSSDSELNSDSDTRGSVPNADLARTRDAPCGTCDIDCSSDLKHRDLVRDEDAPPHGEVPYVKAELLARLFHQMTNISLWHIVSRGYSDLPLTRTKGAIKEGAKEQVEQICLICGLHNCSMHGAYVEDETGEVEDVNPVVALDDREMDKNRRLCFATNADPVLENNHECGVWCGGPDNSLSLYKGVEDDGRIDGYINTAAFDVTPTPYLPDDERCSDSCFWSKKNREPRAIATLEGQDKQVFLSNLRQCMMNQRGPCMMHDMLPHIRCADLFVRMLLRGKEHSHPATMETSPQTKHRAKSKAKANGKIDLSHDHPVERRGVFLPCDHDGPCSAENECRCARAKVACERSCKCSRRCERLFPGCNCGLGSNVCADNKCACWQAGRECDPVLCKGCGVETVLHQAYKYDEKMRIGRCRNNRIQLGLPARTIKAPSEVQGYGLFAGQDLRKGDFITEYRGEIISQEESDRRGAMYSLAGQEYLFTLNTDQEVDANNFGNKARFMNNSGKDANINVFGQLMFCNGQHRIGLYAKRDIKAGEELLYNYEYPEAVTKQFWERGEKSAKSKAATVLIPAAARTRQTPDTKQRRKIRPQLDNQDSSAKGKRKHDGLHPDDSRASLRDEVDDFDPMELDETALNMNDKADELDPDFTEYEGGSQESSGNEVPDSEVDDDDEMISVRPGPNRRRK